MNVNINDATQKIQRQTHGPTGLCELFLLTVPIEEVARWQYKTIQIIFCFYTLTSVCVRALPFGHLAIYDHKQVLLDIVAKLRFV